MRAGINTRVPYSAFRSQSMCAHAGCRYGWRQIAQEDSDPFWTYYPHLSPLPSSLLRLALVFQEFASPIRSLLVCFHHTSFRFSQLLYCLYCVFRLHIFCIFAHHSFDGKTITLQLIRKERTSSPNLDRHHISSPESLKHYLGDCHPYIANPRRLLFLRYPVLNTAVPYPNDNGELVWKP